MEEVDDSEREAELSRRYSHAAIDPFTSLYSSSPDRRQDWQVMSSPCVQRISAHNPQRNFADRSKPPGTNSSYRCTQLSLA